MPEIQTQIDALREAFSADPSRAFELKPSFPYGSPGTNMQSSPPMDGNHQRETLRRQASHDQAAQAQYHPPPLTPPISGEHDDQDGSIAATSLDMLSNGQHQPISMSSASIETDQAAWNPTRIFEYRSDKHQHKVKSNTNNFDSQWNTAFGTPGSMIGAGNNGTAQPSPPLYTPTSIGAPDIPPLHNVMQPQQQQYSAPSSITPLSQNQPLTTQSCYPSIAQSFVTPSMWRDTVASTFDSGGQKRRWDMESSYLIDPVQSKRLR